MYSEDSLHARYFQQIMGMPTHHCHHMQFNVSHGTSSTQKNINHLASTSQLHPAQLHSSTMAEHIEQNLQNGSS